MSAMRLQQSVVEWLRIARPGCLWFHAPARTDFAPRLRNGLARLGIGAGVPDLVFLLPGGRVACVVLRDGARQPSRAERAFAVRCRDLGVPYHSAQSVAEVAGHLKTWGLM